MRVTLTPSDLERIDFSDDDGRPCHAEASNFVDHNRPDAVARPGSSYLWLGIWHPDLRAPARMHLSRTQARELARHLAAWAETGSLVPAPVAESGTANAVQPSGEIAPDATVHLHVTTTRGRHMIGPLSNRDAGLLAQVLVASKAVSHAYRHDAEGNVRVDVG